MSNLDLTLNLDEPGEITDENTRALLDNWNDQLQRTHRELVNAIQDTAMTEQRDVFRYMFMMA